MIIKALDFKEYASIPLKDIINKYKKSDSVKFTNNEFKSLLSICFSTYYHYPVLTKDNIDEVHSLRTEKDSLINITLSFGRHMIENLNSYNQESLEKLQNNTYELKTFFSNNEILDFVDSALIDYMNIRNLEYGKYFIQNLANLFSKSINLKSYSLEIKKAIEKDGDYLKLIGEKIINSKVKLEVDEQLLLVFVIKEYFFESKSSNYDYYLANSIIKENIYKINFKKEDMIKALGQSLKMKWNIGRGKGGRRI